MAKLNRVPKRDRQVVRTTTRAAVGPLGTKKGAPTLTTYQGAPAFEPKLKTELFLLAVNNMVGEDTFYEQAGDRDSRFRSLVHRVAVKDPVWMLNFVGWLRGEGNMRTASIVAAAEAVKARLDAGVGVPVTGGAFTRKPGQPMKTFEIEANPVTSRKIIDAALQRADEPGELLAYWLANYGRNVPKPVKRGLADAARRLYNEYSLLKYDTASHAVRFGDVLDLVHPTPATPDQAALFTHALDRRHGRDTELDHLPMIAANASLRGQVANGHVAQLLNSDALKAAGMTWEDALPLAGSRVPKARLWEALIPSMGYMALLRNLRNFDEAGISETVAQTVCARIMDLAQVQKSRQLPFRFYTAYQAAPSDRWKHALGVALDLACANIPALPGRTLVLIDTSASMTQCTISAKSQVTAAQAAAVLGIVLAKRCDADVYGWATGSFRHKLQRGQTAMQGVTSFLARTGEAGHGTVIANALGLYSGHDRVFLLSDMQGMNWYNHMSPGRDMGDLIPADVPLYTFVLDGYRGSPVATGKSNRHALAGLSDATFRMVPMLEMGDSPDWDTLFGTAS